MANNLTYQISLQFTGVSPTLSLTPSQGAANIATKEFVGRSLSLTTSRTALDLGNLTSSGVGAGLIFVLNPATANADPKDLTNVIHIAPNGTDAALVVVRPGRYALFEIATLLSPFTAVTPQAFALLGTPTLNYWVIPSE